jgi:hypothetical protein
MFKDFSHHTAWTDTMKDALGYAGIIGYHSTKLGAPAHTILILEPEFNSESAAKSHAEKMLEKIKTITRAGELVFFEE